VCLSVCLQYAFMDMASFEETRVPGDDSWVKYLKEGMDVQLVLWNGRVLSVDLPNTVELEVVETDPGVKGNTASGDAPMKSIACTLSCLACRIGHLVPSWQPLIGSSFQS
jgi:Elongation factor P (EF-P) OB domain